MIKVLFIADLVGDVGLRMVKKNIRELKATHHFDIVICNGENLAPNNGITPSLFEDLSSSGVDVVTLGNHVWDRREIIRYIEDAPYLVRPANYPEGTPGKGYCIYDIGHSRIGVISLLGNIYINNLTSPFFIIDRLIADLKREGCNSIIVDMHGEATSEKLAMGIYLDGRVSAVLGTHTHIQTADDSILPKGTAYITDCGMTGPINSILGVKPELIINRFITQMPVRFEHAEGPGQFNGVILEIDRKSGLALKIERINIKENL